MRLSDADWKGKADNFNDIRYKNGGTQSPVKMRLVDAGAAKEAAPWVMDADLLMTLRVFFVFDDEGKWTNKEVSSVQASKMFKCRVALISRLYPILCMKCPMNWRSSYRNVDINYWLTFLSLSSSQLALHVD